MDGNNTSSQWQPGCELWRSYFTEGLSSGLHCTRAQEAWALAGVGVKRDLG